MLLQSDRLSSGGNLVPRNERERAGRAAFDAGAAHHALGGLLGHRVDGRHMPRAGSGAGAAANALIGINLTDTVDVSVNRVHRAGIAAGRIFALTAGIREVHPVILGVQTVAIAAGVQVAGNLDTRDVAGAAAIIGQGAVDFAALAANAAIRIDHEQTLRERPDPNLIFGQSSGGHAESREHRGGHRDANQALTRELEELTAREVLVEETFLVRHGFLSSLIPYPC